jgi:3-deoxy-D-manno-octulosonic-acid transferase
MEDFRDERERLETAGGGITVRDGAGMLQRILALMEDPEERRRRGEAGRDIVTSNRGAAGRYAGMIQNHLQ